MAQPLLAGIIKSVSGSPLNDQEVGHEYTRWTIPDLTDYLNQGLVEIGNYRPDAFIQIVNNFGLAVGYQQVLPVGYRQLKSVDANGSASICFAGVPITQCDLQLLKTFVKQPPIPTGGVNGHRILNYAYDIKNPKLFYVSPPVPVNTTLPVDLTLIAEPSQYAYNGTDWGLITNPAAKPDLLLDQAYFTALRFFMAAKAFEVDTESSGSQTQSIALYKKFYNSLGVQYSQIAKFNAGDFGGQGGDKQMTKARVP